MPKLSKTHQRIANAIIAIGLVGFFLAFLGSHKLLQELSVYDETQPILITGKVVDSKTGEPISNAEVQQGNFLPDGYVTVAKTNTKGMLNIKYPGGFWLQAAVVKQGYEDQLIEVPVRHYFGKYFVSGRHLGLIKLRKLK